MGLNPLAVGREISRDWTRHEEVKIHGSSNRYAIRENESGTKVAEIARRLGISQATYFTWEKKYGDRDVTELKRLRTLEDENAQLKKLVADLCLDKQMLQDILKN